MLQIRWWNFSDEAYSGDDASIHSFFDSQTKPSNILATSVGEISKNMSENMLHEEIMKAYSSTCTVVSGILRYDMIWYDLIYNVGIQIIS